MGGLFESGRIIDLILLAVLVEVVVLHFFLRRFGTRLRLRHLLPDVLAGVALLFALRFALVDREWHWVAAALTAALLAHLVALLRRWQDSEV
ncbi:MAG: hypothetical protein AAGI44_08320 [Pseudomonadota bacterium]